MNEARIFGLGTRVPEETTIETLMAIEECPALFSALESRAAEAWLRRRAPRLRRLRSVEELVAAARAGGPVGLAVWGHPSYSSAAARAALPALRAAGIACRVYGAVSPVGSAFARSISFLGGDYGYQGVQSYALASLLEDPSRWTPRLPLVAFAESARPADWRRLAALLGEALPPGHALRVYPLGSEEERRVPLEAFPGPALRGALVLVPPVGGAPRQPRERAP